MIPILFLYFPKLKLLAVFDPHPPKLLQGKKGKILLKAAQEPKPAGFHNGLENCSIKRLVRPKKLSLEADTPRKSSRNQYQSEPQ